MESKKYPTIYVQNIRVEEREGGLRLFAPVGVFLEKEEIKALRNALNTMLKRKAINQQRKYQLSE